MQKIVAENLPFERARRLARRGPRAVRLARRELQGRDHRLDPGRRGGLATTSTASFIDLCRGPHVERTGDIKAFKVLSFAGAYWRGDERNPQLQRIYGTAFSDEGGARRAPRTASRRRRSATTARSGKELDLFSIEETVGGGLVLWHPKGRQGMQGCVPSFFAQACCGIDGQAQVITDGRALAALRAVFVLALAPFARQIELRKRGRGYYSSRQQDQIRALHSAPHGSHIKRVARR